MSEMSKLKLRLAELELRGCTGIRVTPASNLDGLDSEVVAKELNEMLDAIEGGKTTPLKLNDSQKSELYEKAPWWANPDLPAPKVTC